MPSEAPFEVERRDHGPETAELRFTGEIAFDDASRLWLRARDLVTDARPNWRFDFSNVSSLDGGSAALVLRVAEDLREAGASVEIVGATGEVARILELYGSRQNAIEPLPEPPDGLLTQVGRDTAGLIAEAGSILSFFGAFSLASVAAIRDPGAVYWKSVTRLMERTGADALPIIALITFLVGLVTAYQAAIPLEQVGANIFVADLVGLSMTRELGPLMTAIIAAGRSGAAFAAELGTMEVGEEVDALYAMGLEPYRFLVLPRVLAVVLMMPILVLFADVIGILGGMVVASTVLDLTPIAYLTQLRTAVDAWDVFSGALKAVFFGFAIALIACQRGLATRGGAEGVGRATTGAVVSILFSLILIDAFFTVLFHLVVDG